MINVKLKKIEEKFSYFKIFVYPVLKVCCVDLFPFVVLLLSFTLSSRKYSKNNVFLNFVKVKKTLFRMGFLSALQSWLGIGKRQVNIIVVGLDNSGKVRGPSQYFCESWSWKKIK